MPIDYSQHGQALILQQLITADTPRVVVDIGAHDGITGSNSRALVEQGWRAILVEPLPAVFAQLKENCRAIPNVTLFQAACSDRSGRVFIRVGIDGDTGQLSSISKSNLIAPNLTAEALAVPAMTLADLFEQGGVASDFGVLLTDTEGLDFRVLQGLDATVQRPRIIVTEDFSDTDLEKYALLTKLDYRFVGAWGPDSVWISQSHRVDTTSLRLPVRRLPADWKPSGTPVSGRLVFESVTRQCVIGWAFFEANRVPPLDVVVDLRRAGSPQRYVFGATRTPRPDVAAHFQSSTLYMSGFRACIDVPSGQYELHVIQQAESSFSDAMVEDLSVG
jgi:FkbM family methyltransferase